MHGQKPRGPQPGLPRSIHQAGGGPAEVGATLNLRDENRCLDRTFSQDFGETMGAGVEKTFLILLSEVARRIRVHADRSARKHGMTWAQLMILRRLERQPWLSQIELSDIAEVAPMTIARLVDRIEARGLVERHADPRDRRIWRLRMTPAATAALRDSERHQANLDEVILKGMDCGGLDAMVDGLRQMKANLSRSNRLAKAVRGERPHIKA
jgi:MarR family transcriptional regulator for hemolysin